MESPSKRRYRLSVKLLLAAFSTVVALLVCEVVIRLSGLAPEVIPIDLSAEDSLFQRSSNELLGYELRKNFRGTGANSRAGVYTNAIGQRDIERSVEKPAGVTRTIVLGDSVVQGVGIHQADQTLSRQLEIITADPMQEFLNFGVDGYCTRAEVELLEVKGLALQPDQVILVFAENDFNNFNPEIERLSYDRPKAINQLFMASSVFRLACLNFNWFGFGIEEDPIRWNSEAIGDNNVVDGLSRLKELSGEHGFELLIVVWPRFEDDAIVDLHSMPGGEELVIERLAGINDIPAVRLSRFFREHWEASGASTQPRLAYTVGDMMHPSVRGNRVAAESIRTILDSPGDYSLHGGAVNVAGDQGRAGIEAARDLGTRNAPTYYRRVINDGISASETSGDWSRAEQLYREAISLRPELPHAYFNLGVLYESQGKMIEAREQYVMAVNCDDRHFESHCNLALLHARGGQFKDAARYFRSAIEIQPRFLQAQFSLGQVYLDMNEPERAARQFKIVLEQQPGHREALRALAEIEKVKPRKE